MYTIRLLQFGLALAAVAPLCAQAAPLGVKPGAWELTLTTTMGGKSKARAPSFSKDELNDMSPEDRAAARQLMTMRKGKPVTSSNRQCVKDSDGVIKLVAGGPNPAGCKLRIVSQTASSVEMEVSCAPPDAEKAHVTVRALSPREMTFTMDAAADDGRTMHSDGKWRWVKAACRCQTAGP